MMVKSKNTQPTNILIIRLSAMGDVAMTVPVVWSAARQCPQMRFTVLTTPAFAPMFANVANVSVFGFDKKGKHKGFFGIIRLFLDLKKQRFDAVADLHDVLRTKILHFLFFFTSTQTAKIDKGRKEKHRLTKNGKDASTPLKSTFERYHAVFEKLKLHFDIRFHSIFDEKPLLPSFFDEKRGRWIGIAPFAKHRGKIYPLKKTEQVVALLDAAGENTLFLFGAGTDEKAVLSAWAVKYPSVRLMPDGCRLPDELALMAHLDVMLSMDSANMHLASLVGVPVVSVWGATHWYAGFLGFGQKAENIVEADLPCRPCSIYGNKPCRRGDYACLHEISPEKIADILTKKE